MAKLPSYALDVRLIALDLDDTLLDSNRKISDKNVQVLQECVRRGIYVVLCSGRAEDGILPFVRRMDIAGSEFGKFIIAINGCSVFDMHERKQIYTCSVDSSVLLKANSEAEKMGLRSEVYSPDTIFYAEETPWTRKDVDMCGLKGKVIDDYETFLREKNFPKCLFRASLKLFKCCKKNLKLNLEIPPLSLQANRTFLKSFRQTAEKENPSTGLLTTLEFRAHLQWDSGTA